MDTFKTAALHVKPYQYRPLESPTHIRLLTLLPPSEDGLSSCKIEHAIITEPPPFDALSYVWGNSEKPHRIFCGDEGYISITASLNEALFNLFYLKTSRKIWIDGICINQDNIDERSHQVMLMGKIYRDAFQVITYIGPHTDEHNIGLHLARTLVEYYNRTSEEPVDQRIFMPDEFIALGFPPDCDPSWVFLRDLLRLPWASRMWMVQESVLNQNVTMMCGRNELPWTMLADLIHIVLTQKRLPEEAVHGSINSKTIEDAGSGLDLMAALRRAAFKNEVPLLTLLELLRTCHTLKSTDPRDKIYALLGISKDAIELGVTPDYKAPVSKVYLEIAASILTHYRDLDILSEVYRKKQLGLPSWVPDWSFRPREVAPALLAQWVQIPGVYRASGSSDSNVRINKDAQELIVDGALVGTIAYTSSSLMTDDTPRITFEWLMSHLQRTLQHGRYKADNEACDAFYRALAANIINHKECGAPAEWAIHIKNFLDYIKKSHITQLVSNASGFITSFARSREETELASVYLGDLARALPSRQFSITGDGYLALTPEGTEVGDRVAILMGGKLLYTLRKFEDEDAYQLIGETYVHGLMKGEALEMEGFKIQHIVLR